MSTEISITRSTTATGNPYKGFTDEEKAAMQELTAAEEARISTLVKKAVS